MSNVLNAEENGRQGFMLCLLKHACTMQTHTKMHARTYPWGFCQLLHHCHQGWRAVAAVIGQILWVKRMAGYMEVSQELGTPVLCQAKHHILARSSKCKFLHLL